LPVVVYLHPGLNTFGDKETYDPKYWMDEDVVVVVPNWRQSLFGFLSTNDMYAPGNQGIRDQQYALKWIKQNIENFGGDKSRVTLVGSSTGGSDAIIHTLSPQSKGLISNVVAMGGSPLSRHSMIRKPITQAKKLGEQVGCPTDSSQALVMCLKQKDAKEIVEKMNKVDLNDINAENLAAMAWFGPTVDKLQEGQTEQDLVIPDHPFNLLATGKIVNKVPLIIGGNEFDGITPITAILLKNPALFEKVDKQWDELAPLLLLYKDSATDKDVVSSKIKQFYFEGKPISNETFVKLSEIFMDRFMGYPVVVTAKLFSKSAPVYLYYFSHTPETSSLKMYGVENQNFGMAHLDDLQFLFKITHDNLPYPELTKESKEYQLSHGLVKLLSSFAETGKPTKTWGEGKEWKKNEAGQVDNWYKLGEVTELQSPAPEQFQKRVGFWVELFQKEMANENKNAEIESF
jgi:carboxylesterase type B